MVKSETIHELYIEVRVCVTNGEEDIFGDEAPSVNQSVLDAANSAVLDDFPTASPSARTCVV